MPTLILTGATWIDVNTGFTENAYPDRLPDAHAVLYSGLENLFGCRVGERGRTFQPLFGSYWHRYIHEPIADVTANAMEMGMIQSIKQWEPRIKLNRALTRIVPNLLLPGYQVRVAFTMLQGANTLHKLQFDLKV